MDNTGICLGIVGSDKEAINEYLNLNFAKVEGLSVSTLHTPGKDDDRASYSRLSGIGTVNGEGPIVQILPFSRADMNPKSSCFSIFLFDLGVPESHHTIYENALEAGEILVILRGTENRLRKAYPALEFITMEKPILYLT